MEKRTEGARLVRDMSLELFMNESQAQAEAHL